MRARRLGDDYATVNNYLIALNTIVAQIGWMRTAQRARVVAWDQAARAANYEMWKIIEWGLKPWNAWEQTVADLADITIPLEIMRLQRDPSAPIGNLASFQPPPAPALPPIIVTPSSGSGSGGSTGPGAPANSPPATFPPATLPPNGEGSSGTPPPTDWLEGNVAGVPVKALVIGGGAFLLLVLLAKR